MPSPISIYPWKRWFSKQQFKLKRHRDFDSQPHGMANLIRLKAKRYKAKVSISIDEDELTVTVIPNPQKTSGNGKV